MFVTTCLTCLLQHVSRVCRKYCVQIVKICTFNERRSGLFRERRVYVKTGLICYIVICCDCSVHRLGSLLSVICRHCSVHKLGSLLSVICCHCSVHKLGSLLSVISHHCSGHKDRMESLSNMCMFDKHQFYPNVFIFIPVLSVYVDSRPRLNTSDSYYKLPQIIE